MSLINWKPLNDFDDLFNFKTVARDLAVDVYQENGNVFVKMHTPGIDADKIDISVKNRHLHISGSREVEQETEDQQYFHREIHHGSFERVIALPVEVDQSKARAESKDGVLTIFLPVKEPSNSAKIKIEKK